MKKIIYQTFILAMTLSLASCFSDDSSLGNTTVGDISISGIEESYDKIAYMGEYIDVEPKVEADEDVTYTWLLLSGKTGTDDADGNEIQPEVIGREKDLRYEVNLAPGTYQLRLVAKGKSGYAVYKTSTLTVRTTFSQGFYVLKENAEGNTDLDLITLDGKTGFDLITSIDGKALQGKPQSLGTQYNAFYVNPDDDQMAKANFLYVTTESGDFRIARSTDLKSVFDRSNIKYEKMEDSERPYSFFATLFYNVMLTNRGLYKTDSDAMGSANTGRYGMVVSSCGGSRYNYCDLSAFTGGVLWDSVNHNLLTYNYNLALSPLLKGDLSGEEITQNLQNYECLGCGFNKLSSGSTGVIVMRDDVSSKRYLYLTQGSFSGTVLSDRKQIREDSHAGKATYYGINGISASYLYCVDAGHVYAMNFKDDDMGEVELKPEGIAADETINFVANQFWNPGSKATFNYLIFGTQKGDTYKLYFYDTNGGAPVGKPLMTMEGKGNIKCVRFLNTNCSSNALMFGYFTNNSCD